MARGLIPADLDNEPQDECYGCNVSEEDEEMFDCEGCGQVCCGTCLGENCGCDDAHPMDGA